MVKLSRLFFGVVACLLFAGCDSLPLPGQSQGEAALRPRVADFFFPLDSIQEAPVTLTRIEVRRAERNEDGFRDRVVVFEGEEPFDLLDLMNGRVDLLAGLNVPADSYDQVRLVVENGRVVLSDGREFDLRVPAGAWRGVRLNVDFDVSDSAPPSLVLDVDLSRAFRALLARGRPNANAIRAFRFDSTFSRRQVRRVDGGNLSGFVADPDDMPLAAAQVAVFDADDNHVSGGASQDDGSFMLNGVSPGLYRMEFSAEGYETEELEDVEVLAGQTTDVGVVTLYPEILE